MGEFERTYHLSDIQKIKEHLSKNDEVLKNIIKTVDIPMITSSNNVFNDLLSCVIEQQIHYRSTKKTFKKLLAKAGLETVTITNFEHFEEASLQDINISMKKVETIHELVTYFKKNEHHWDLLSDEEITQILSSIKGIGDWTIHMILLYTLKREDVFPYADFHLKKIMTEQYQIESRLKQTMIDIAQEWKPYSSFATRYLLAFKNKRK